MGERKGQNKYYPPDYDPKKGGLNKFLGTHALRERARKIHLGIIIIRFEMPYNIWCDGCKNHIGMGVRYNAEKTKVGMYYSTPIYKFRMKCHLCDNHFEIQTDPANLDYTILSGARRQENRWDPTENGQVVSDTKELQKRLFDDAMFRLEHQANDIATGEKAKPVLEKLVDRNKTVWDDCYEANCKLRTEFRKTKKELQLQKELDDRLVSKFCLEIPLLPENQQDREMASLMNLQSKSAQERQNEKRLDILLQPALLGVTATTFVGLKRQKALGNHLEVSHLGIKKKSKTEIKSSGQSSTKDTTLHKETLEEEEEKEKEKSAVNAECLHPNKSDICNDKHASLQSMNLPKSLVSLCDYSSCNSSSTSPSISDNE